VDYSLGLGVFAGHDWFVCDCMYHCACCINIDAAHDSHIGVAVKLILNTVVVSLPHTLHGLFIGFMDL